MFGSRIENILGKPAGSVIEARPDICMINDGEGHKAVDLLTKEIIAFNIVVVLDHDIPAGSFDSAFIQKKLIDFSKKYDLEFIQSYGTGYYALMDRMADGMIGVSCGGHNCIWGAKGALGLSLTPAEMAEYLENGYFKVKVPETIRIDIIGELNEGVSATDAALSLIKMCGELDVQGKVIEYTASEDLSEDDRTAICAYAYRAGAMSAIFNLNPESFKSDFTFDLSTVNKTVAAPGTLKNINELNNVKGTKVDACFIGGCLGGRIHDIRKAADILKGKKICYELRLLVGFTTNEVYLQAAEEGLIDIFFDCGAQVTNPGCGSCKTTSIGVVGDNETLFTTGCYNYPGCAGTEQSKVFIGSVEDVAKSALSGRIKS